nr:hypothetical protein [Tanacetum cinerariifolium]
MELIPPPMLLLESFNSYVMHVSHKGSREGRYNISSDINPLFDEVLKNIKSKDSYDSNLDEPYYDSEGDILYLESFLNDDVVHRDPSIPAMNVASILEGFTDEPPLEENDDLFDLESKNDYRKKICLDLFVEIPYGEIKVHLKETDIALKDKNKAKTDKIKNENGKSVILRV